MGFADQPRDGRSAARETIRQPEKNTKLEHTYNGISDQLARVRKSSLGARARAPPLALASKPVRGRQTSGQKTMLCARFSTIFRKLGEFEKTLPSRGAAGPPTLGSVKETTLLTARGGFLDRRSR